MNSYKDEKKRYAKVAAFRWQDGDPSIMDYHGNNPFKILGRKLAKAIKYYRIMNDNKLYIGHLAVVTSYACNLNCKGCGQHIPWLKRMPADKLSVNMMQIKNDLDKISAAVDGIAGIAVANGEGFMNPHIGELMEYYAGNPKIASMNIPTNGSVMPKKEDMEKMRKYKVTCSITRYNSIPEETRQRFIDTLAENHITYGLYMNRKWYLHEYVDNLKVSDQIAKEKYKRCEHYFMLRDSQLWRCEVDATRVKIGIRPARPGDFIVVKESTVDEVRGFLIEKASLPFLPSCLHCRGCWGPDAIEIPAGEQMNGEQIREEGRRMGCRL